MIEIAVRIKELASSNLNSLVAGASSPVKMLKLLQLELEEAIIALAADQARSARAARDAAQRAAAQDQAAADWQDKAKLALTKGREDLARGALDERRSALADAAALRRAAEAAEAEQTALAEAVAGLETKLAETRTRLRREQDKATAAAPGTPSGAADPGTRARSRVDTLNDRLAVLEKRIDFAAADTADATKAADLDSELAALQRETELDADLAALKKHLKK